MALNQTEAGFESTNAHHDALRLWSASGAFFAPGRDVFCDITLVLFAALELLVDVHVVQHLNFEGYCPLHRNVAAFDLAQRDRQTAELLSYPWPGAWEDFDNASGGPCLRV